MRPEGESLEVLLGRQPILDAGQRLYGFELLFRHSRRVNQAYIDSDIAATARVITQTFGDFGIDAVIGNTKGLINVDQTLLMSESIEFLPRENIVLEILETTPPTPPILERCKDLVAKGFTLAVDDVTVESQDYLAFLPYVDLVKIEIKDRPWEEIQALTRALLPTGKTLLAEKIDQKEQVDICKKMGFSLYQGYYFATPTIITGKRIGHSDFSLLQLLNLLSNDASASELVSILKHEPGLSLQLIRTVNSAAMGLTSEITSIHHALTILGRHQMRRWVQLLLYAKLGGGDSPLLQLATSRGRLMELVASKLKKTSQDFQEKAFLVGTFSLLDVLCC